MSNVLWKNEHFEIDDEGLNWVSYRYYIEGSRLLEETERGNDEYYDWPVHLAETKVDFPLVSFEEAFRKALLLLKSTYDGEADMAKVERSFRYARREKQYLDKFRKRERSA